MSRRLRGAAAIVVTLMVGSCSGGGSLPKQGTSSTPVAAIPATTSANATASPTAPVDPAEPVNLRLATELQDQGRSVERATQLFSLEVAKLPGVSVPAGTIAPQRSGTFAAQQLLAVYGDLTDEQRAFAAPYLGLAKRAPASDLPAALPPPSSFPPITQPAARPISYSPTLEQDLRYATTEQWYQRFRPIADWANNAVAALVGKPPLNDDFTFDFARDGLASGELAATNCWSFLPLPPIGKEYQFGRLPACNFHINLDWFIDNDESLLYATLAHEMFHAYMSYSFANKLQQDLTSRWLIEGEPTWVGNVLVPAVADGFNTYWRDYLFAPKKHLYQRKYDALGFFGHLSDVAGVGVVAKRLLDAAVVGSGGHNDEAFAWLTGEEQDRFLDTWASSYFMAHDGKELWKAKGPGATANIPGKGPSPETVSVGTGGATATLPPSGTWEHSLVRLDSNADIVEFTVDRGHVALIDASEKVNIKFAFGDPVTFCLIGKCECPSDATGEVPPTIPAQAPFDVGLTGWKQSAGAHARGWSLSDFCKHVADKQPGGGPGGGGAAPDADPEGSKRDGFEPPHGKASSDPHIATIDGRWYDVQTTGEFVLSKSTVDGFSVQVRFGAGSGSRTWSTTTGVATKVGKDRVGVYLNLAAAEPIPVLTINGVATDRDYIALDGAAVRAVTTRWGPGYVITFRDGTRVGANSTAREGLSGWVDPADVRRGKLIGLLGDGDGDMKNDPKSASGVLLPEIPSYDELYTTFASSWRITQADSLFDYPAGQTTAAYSDVSFPDRDKPAATPAALDTARELCKERGVGDADLLRNCAFDVAATGRTRIASSYQTQQRRVDYIAALQGTGVVTIPSVASGKTKSTVIEGKVAATNDQPIVKFEGGKGDVIYIDSRNCIELRFSELVAPNGKSLTTSVLCGLRVVLPADGTYSVKLNVFADKSGDYRYPIVAVRPDNVRPITLGATMTGAITNRAEQDVFTLSIVGPTTISIPSDGCVGNFDITIYYGDDELVTAGNSCRFGSTVLPKAGTYRFVFNPFNTTTGNYRVTLNKA